MAQKEVYVSTVTLCLFDIVFMFELHLRLLGKSRSRGCTELRQGSKNRSDRIRIA